MDAVDTGVINDPTAVDNQPVAPSVPDESATEEDDWDKMLAMLEEQLKTQSELADAVCEYLRVMASEWRDNGTGAIPPLTSVEYFNSFFI